MAAWKSKSNTGPKTIVELVSLPELMEEVVLPIISEEKGELEESLLL